MLNYGYPVNQIKQYLSLQMGSETKEADIIVYADDEYEETFILVEFKKEEITDQQIILKQFEQHSSGYNYPAITQEELRNVTIPVPDKKTQENIIKVFNKCLDQKQEYEYEAEKILSSIDNYLLKVLGITLTILTNNTVKNGIL